MPGYFDPTNPGGNFGGGYPPLLQPPGMPNLLTGAPPTGGSNTPAGGVPQVPNPSASGNAAITGNLGNVGDLQRLLYSLGGSMVPNYPSLASTQSRNISELLNSPDPRVAPGAYADEFRRAAERGSATGISGSAAEESLGYHLTDEERIRRQMLGSQELSQALGQANTILPLQNFQTTPQDQQQWQYLANLLASSPNPELAFQRSLQLANLGLGRGYNAGYGGGGARPFGGGSTVGQPAQTVGGGTPEVQNPLPNPNLPSSAYAPPPTYENDLGLPENWTTLSPDQQQSYVDQLITAELDYNPDYE